AHLDGAAVGDVALHPAEGALGVVEVLAAHLLAEEATIGIGIVDERGNDGHGGEVAGRPAGRERDAEVGHEDGDALLADLVPEGDHRVARAEVDPESSGHGQLLTSSTPALRSTLPSGVATPTKRMTTGCPAARRASLESGAWQLGS